MCYWSIADRFMHWETDDYLWHDWKKWLMLVYFGPESICRFNTSAAWLLIQFLLLIWASCGLLVFRLCCRPISVNPLSVIADEEFSKETECLFSRKIVQRKRCCKNAAVGVFVSFGSVASCAAGFSGQDDNMVPNVAAIVISEARRPLPRNRPLLGVYTLQ